MSTRYRPTRPGPSWGKKDKRCDPSKPEDRERGSYWDNVLIDAETKLIVSLVVGRRTYATARRAFADFYARTDGRLPLLITTDEYAAYFSVIVGLYGVRKEDLGLSAAEKEELGWESLPEVLVPPELNYGTVHKERERGQVVRVESRVVLGTAEAVAAVLAGSSASQAINTSYVERWNGTQRHFNARKGRKVCTFSKDLAFHVAVTWLVVTWYNFCWTVRTLRQQVQVDPPRYQRRTPAMAAGLAAQPWSLRDLLTYPLFPTDRQPGPSEHAAPSKRPDGG
jgi:IS1 family transposase